MVQWWAGRLDLLPVTQGHSQNMATLNRWTSCTPGTIPGTMCSIFFGAYYTILYQSPNILWVYHHFPLFKWPFRTLLLGWTLGRGYCIGLAEDQVVKDAQVWKNGTETGASTGFCPKMLDLHGFTTNFISMCGILVGKNYEHLTEKRVCKPMLQPRENRFDSHPSPKVVGNIQSRLYPSETLSICVNFAI